MLKKLLFLFISSLLLNACGVKDPSVNDLKSPCVSNDLDAKSPCARRIPLENYIV